MHPLVLFSRRCMALLCFPILALPALAQAIHLPPRMVCIDVTVADAQGKPVVNLPESAFHLADSGQPQTIRSFAPRPLHPSAKTIAGGSRLSHAVYNVALLDISSMPVVDQMALRRQLISALRQAPLTEPVALYLRSGPRIVRLQGFTTRRAALLAAVRHAIPRAHPRPAQPDVDVRIFSQMTHHLSQYPGRKNLLWFHGKATLALLSTRNAVPTHPAFPPRVSLGYSPLFNAMAAERIALYPIGVRWPAPATSRATQANSLFQAEAALTGGHAYRGIHDVAPATRAILARSPRFYTLTYSSGTSIHASHWHRIRITVDGPYHLRYRRGYFDNNYQPTLNPDPPAATPGENPPPPNAHRAPIVFHARVHLAAPSNNPQPTGTRLYTIHYRLPAAAFQHALLHRHASSRTLGLAILVLDPQGNILAHRQKLLSLPSPHAATQGSFAVTQTIAAPGGHIRLYLAVWNTATGRLGTLQLPVNA